MDLLLLLAATAVANDNEQTATPIEVGYSVIRVLEHAAPVRPPEPWPSPLVTCTVEITFDDQGKATSATAEKTEGCPEAFATAASDAAIKWTFEPPMNDGKPTSGSFTAKFRFE